MASPVSVRRWFFTTQWPVKEAKYWFRATFDTLSFSKHKQDFGTADCCNPMRNQELPPCLEHKTGTDSDFLSDTAYFSSENKTSVLGTQEIM